MLENKKIYVPQIGEEVHMSRLIASWTNQYGNMCGVVYDKYGEPEFAFREWLRELGIGEDGVYDIWEYANCGKLELEHSARKFMKDHEVLDE